MNNVTSINKIKSPEITSDFQKQSIGFDINKEYCDITEQRIKPILKINKLF